MKNKKIKFNNRNDKEFVTVLRARIEAYFTENKISKKANGPMILKTIILLSVTYGLYFVMLFVGLPGFLIILFYTLMGLGFASIGFNVGHDALHGAYSDNKVVNNILGYSFNMMGANDFFWKIKHNVRHHTYTNIFHHDDDLDVSAMLRLSPNAPYKKIHRVQHIMAFVWYSLLSLAWAVYLDFAKLNHYRKNAHLIGYDKYPKVEAYRLFGFKALYFLYTLVIPLILLHNHWFFVLIGFLTMHIVLGLTLAIVFQLAHIVEDTKHPVPDTENYSIENAWAVHQMETTANFAVRNKVITWLVGGLNFQVEHHLFPNICSIHYPAVSKIVNATAQEYHIRYNNQNSFFMALGSHYRLLKKFGQPPL